MRWDYAFLLLFVASFSHANTYQISSLSSQPEAAIRAKNCLDYLYCNTSTTRFVYKKDINKFSSVMVINLSPAEMSNAISSCGLWNFKNEIVIRDLTTNFLMPLNLNQRSFLTTENLPAIYLKKLTTLELESLIEKTSKLIHSNSKQAAIDLIIQTFQLPTHGYKVIPGTVPGERYSITSHPQKLITIGDAFFSEPYGLIRGIRHEIEHAAQYSRAISCKTQTNTNHNLEDRLMREYTAHINDLANLNQYCFDSKIKSELHKSILERITDHYGI